MKRFLALATIAMVSALLPSVDAVAKELILVDPATKAIATNIVDGTVVSTEPVEVDDRPHVLATVEVSASQTGTLSTSTIQVVIPGGALPNGDRVFVSNTPEFRAGDQVQLALFPTGPIAATALSPGAPPNLPTFSIVGGLDGTAWIQGQGVSQANGSTDYVLHGKKWPDFVPPVRYRVNPANSGISSASTIAAVRRSFQTWEDDSLSVINFTYDGSSNVSNVNLQDGVNVISWVNTTASETWAAQAWWLSGASEISAFDIRMNRDYKWADGAVAGSVDIESVATHEAGHVVGLGHSPSSSELMFASIPTGATKGLGAGDRMGARVLYPLPTGWIESTAASQITVSGPGGAERDDAFGSAVTGGDFNADGYADFAVAANGENNGAGAVSIIYGGINGLDVSDSQHLNGAANGAKFGTAVASGDFNGDGYDDLAVGSPGERSSEGIVRIYSGSNSGLGSNVSSAFSQNTVGVPGGVEAGDEFGAALAAGDFNGDNRDDLAVGTPGEASGTLNRSGVIVVLYSNSNGLTGTGSKMIAQNTVGVPGGVEAGDEFGAALAAGDFNGDNRDDLAVGTPGEASGTLNRSGVIVVLYSNSNGLTGTGSKMIAQNTVGVPGGVEAGDEFGAALAAGDFNGDNRDDLAVGTPGEASGTLNRSGVIVVLYSNSNGLTGTGSKMIAQNTVGVPGGVEAGDEFGAALAAGDFNGDNRDDLAVGTPGEASGTLNRSGVIVVLYSNSNGLTGTGSKMIAQNTVGVPGGVEAGDEFGAALAAGDFNGDNRDDLAVGTPGEALSGIGDAGVLITLVFG